MFLRPGVPGGEGNRAISTSLRLSHEREIMNPERFTTMSQAAIQEAISAASSSGHPEVVPEHLVIAIIEQADGIGRPLLDLASVNADGLLQALRKEIATLPRVEGGAEPRFGRRMPVFLRDAEKEAQALKDEFVSTEHFLLAASRDKEKMAALFSRLGATHEKLLAALQKAR